MTAKDCLHYANNVALTGDGDYRLTYHFKPPSNAGFIRHVDKESGIPDWWRPFSESWTFHYRSKEVDWPPPLCAHQSCWPSVVDHERSLRGLNALPRISGVKPIWKDLIVLQDGACVRSSSDDIFHRSRRKFSKFCWSVVLSILNALIT